MREIKFRAWDKKGKQMINYISSLNFKNQNFISIVSEYDLDVHNGENLGHYERHVSEVEVMQFTGLQDKNGKEIYEGDIVKIPDDYEEYGFMAGEKREVYYFDACFRFKPKTESRGHTLEDDMDLCEVIGNIYENPELLN